MDKKEVIDYLKALEEGKLITPNAHKDDKVIKTIKSIISMSKEQHDKYQEESPNKSVLMIFSEYQDWKKTYSPS